MEIFIEFGCKETLEGTYSRLHLTAVLAFSRNTDKKKNTEILFKVNANNISYLISYSINDNYV